MDILEPQDEHMTVPFKEHLQEGGGGRYYAEPSSSQQQHKGSVRNLSKMASETLGGARRTVMHSLVQETTSNVSCRTTKKKRELLSVKARIRLKKFAIFWPVKVAQVLCVVYIMILTFCPYPVGLVNPSTGSIIDVTSEENTDNGVIFVNGDYRPVVAQGTFQMICLAISRMSAFSLYPVMILVFLTKCKATTSFFSKTPLSMYTIQDCHELHLYAGHYIAIDVWVHTAFHLFRWADQENISLLWNHRTGLTGLVVVAVTPLITFPMMYAKKSVRYEIRKALHYLFYVFAIGMCFHVPPSAVPNGGFLAYVLGFCIGLYTLDATYIFLFLTEKIDTTTFHVLPTGVQMTMNVSKRFQQRGEKGGFAYVCLPWVDKNQWHAFSLFENPSEPSQRQVFMLNAGDWTNQVHAALQRDTVRPVWVQGPFASPYSNAESFDNQILVASGIGITPALSVIRAHKESRRLNLIWAVRDPSMLEFFMEHMYLDHDGWNLIFYTGTRPLHPALEELNTNVRVHKGRPDLKVVIPNIIYGIESGVGKPETYTPSEIVNVRGLLIERMRDLDAMDLTNKEKLVELTTFASRHGFLFTELVNDLGDKKKRKPTTTRERAAARYPDDEAARNLGVTTDDEETLDSSHSTTPSLRESNVLQRIRDYGDIEYPPQPDKDGNVRRRDSLGLSPIAVQEDQKHQRRKSFEFSRTVSDDSMNASSKAGRSVRRLRRSLTGRHSGKRAAGKVLTSSFSPCENYDKAKDFVKGLDKDAVLSTWGILYCGGSKAVEKDLKEIAMEYDVPLNVESFAW